MKFIKSTFTHTKELVVLVLAGAALLGASYANGQFTNPTNTPPTGNVEVPINTSTNYQTKRGVLGVTGLDVGHNFPRIQIAEGDTNGGTRIAHSNNDLYLQQNQSGSVSSPTWNTSLLISNDGGNDAAGDFVSLADQVRAPQYCDENGANCVDASSGGLGGGTVTEVDPKIATLDSGAWCRSNLAGTAIICSEDKPLQLCIKRRASWTVYSEGARNTAFCPIGETITGGTCHTNATAIHQDLIVEPGHPTYPSVGAGRTGWQCNVPGGNNAAGLQEISIICCS